MSLYGRAVCQSHPVTLKYHAAVVLNYSWTRRFKSSQGNSLLYRHMKLYNMCLFSNITALTLEWAKVTSIGAKIFEMFHLTAILHDQLWIKIAYKTLMHLLSYVCLLLLMDICILQSRYWTSNPTSKYFVLLPREQTLFQLNFVTRHISLPMCAAIVYINICESISNDIMNVQVLSPRH